MTDTLTDTLTETTEETTEQAAANEETYIAQMESVVDFVKTADIKMHVLAAHENPHRTIQEQNSAFHYSCKLINSEDNWFVVYFSKGFGLRTWVQPPEGFATAGSPSHVPHGKINTRYDGPMPPWDQDDEITPLADKVMFEHCSAAEPPFLAEVLNCLANDCRVLEQTQGNFTAWCQRMEVSNDSRYAKEAWDAIAKQRQQLAALLGESEFHRLINETEPLK